MASSSEDVSMIGAASADDEQGRDGEDVTDSKQKKKKFKPMKALKSLFAGKKSSRAKSKDRGSVSKAKSTSELLVAQKQEEVRIACPNALNSNMSMSADSVFSPESVKDSPKGKPEKAVSLEALSTSAGLKAELFTKIQSRQSDEGLPNSLVGSQNMADIFGVGIRPEMSASQESDNSLISMGSESEDEFFNTSWNVGVGPSISVTSAPDPSVDFDFDAVGTTAALKNEAARHKLSVRPKARRASSFAKRISPNTKPAMPSVKEETPPKEIDSPDGAVQASIPEKSKDEEQPAEKLEKKVTPPATKPKPELKLAIVLRGDANDEELTTPEKKSPASCVTKSMLDEVKLRQPKVVSPTENTEKINDGTEFTKAVEKIKRTSQDLEEKLQKARKETKKSSELTKALDRVKRKSGEVEDSGVVSAQNKQETDGMEKQKRVSASFEVIPDKQKNDSIENIEIKTEPVKVIKPAVPRDSKKSDNVQKDELESIKLKSLKKTEIVTDQKDKKNDAEDETEVKNMSVSERMSLFGAQKKIHKKTKPHERSKTVEVESLPSSVTEKKESSSPRSLSYSKSFHGTSGSPATKSKGVIRQQSGSSPDENSPTSPVKVEPKNVLVRSNSTDSSVPEWIKQARKRQTERENEDKESKNVPTEKEVSETAQSIPKLNKTTSSEKLVPKPTETLPKAIAIEDKGKSNTSIKKTPEKIIEIAQTDNSESCIPAWKANLKYKKSAEKKSSNSSKDIVIQEKPQSMKPSELKTQSLGRNVRLESPPPSPEKKTQNKERNLSGSIKLKVGGEGDSKSVITPARPKSKVHDLLKNFQSQEVS